MGTFKNIEDAKKFFENDRFAYTNGITIEELNELSCTCSIKLRDDHKNAIGGVMGGVIFTLADFALAVSSNHIHSPSVAMTVNCNFMSSAKGDTMYAYTECLKSGRTTSVFNIIVKDNTGVLIAQFTGTCFKL